MGQIKNIKLHIVTDIKVHRFNFEEISRLATTGGCLPKLIMALNILSTSVRYANVWFNSIVQHSIKTVIASTPTLRLKTQSRSASSDLPEDVPNEAVLNFLWKR